MVDSPFVDSCRLFVDQTCANEKENDIHELLCPVYTVRQVIQEYMYMQVFRLKTREITREPTCGMEDRIKTGTHLSCRVHQ